MQLHRLTQDDTSECEKILSLTFIVNELKLLNYLSLRSIKNFDFHT